jgi:hypothetical protein
MAVPDEFQATHSVSLLFAAGNPPSSLARSFLVSTFNSMSTRHYTASWWCYTRKTSPFSHQHAHHVRIRPLSSISLSLSFCLFEWALVSRFRIDRLTDILFNITWPIDTSALISCQLNPNKLFIQSRCRRRSFFLSNSVIPLKFDRFFRDFRLLRTKVWWRNRQKICWKAFQLYTFSSSLFFSFSFLNKNNFQYPPPPLIVCDVKDIFYCFSFLCSVQRWGGL